MDFISKLVLIVVFISTSIKYCYSRRKIKKSTNNAIKDSNDFNKSKSDHIVLDIKSKNDRSKNINKSKSYPGSSNGLYKNASIRLTEKCSTCSKELPSNSDEYFAYGGKHCKYCYEEILLDNNLSDNNFINYKNI